VASWANGPVKVVNAEVAHVPPIWDAGRAARNAIWSRMYTTAPIAIEPITARGMSRFGWALSPASWSACSNPSSAKMIPLVETAARTPVAPSGANPSAAVKLPGWKLTIASTAIVSSGTATFHHVAALLVWASLRTLRKLIAVKIAIRTTAATIPVPVRTLSPPLSFIHPCANE
jgi:hypothetical protein